MKPISLVLRTACLASILPCAAAERFWDGGDITNNWTVPANWDGNTALNLATDELNFPSGLALADKALSNNYANNTVFHSLNFAEGGYTVGGSIMALTNGMLAYFPTGSVQINASLTLQGNQSFVANLGGDLIVAGQTFVNSRILSLQPIHADSVVRMDGPVFGNPDGKIRVTNAGRVNINGAKTFRSDVLLENGGTLGINDSAGLGDTDGETFIPSGTLVLDNLLPLNVPEKLNLTNVDAAPGNIISRGGAHTISGGIDVNGLSSFKKITVEGPSLTLSGPMTGSVDIGTVITYGPGKLNLTGTESNTLEVNIFRVSDGELFLNKSGGATALSGYAVIIGHNGPVADSAILRLGASNQISDDALLEISRDAWFDLNGKQETVDFLQFAGAGRVTGNGGTLRILGDVRTFGVLDPGATAQIDCPLVLPTPVSAWETQGAPGLLNLRVTGPVSSSAPDGGQLRKTGEAELTLTGTVTMREVQAEEGLLTMTANNFLTDAKVIQTGKLQASGVLKVVNCESGTLSVGTDTANADLIDQTLTIGAAGTVNFNFTSNAPGGHDTIHTAGTVTIDATAQANFLPLGVVNMAVGEELILIDNGGTDPIVGEFSGDASDHIVATEYWLSYTGGDGNDLSITRIVPPTGVVRTWDGGGNDSEWMTAGNWNPNVAPNPGDTLVFPAVALRKQNHNNYPAGTAFQKITIEGNAAPQAAYAIGGNRVRLNDGLYFTASANDHMWSVPLTFSLPGTISSETTSLVQITGDIDNSGKKLTFQHGDGTLSGVVYMSCVVSGAGGISKTGAGRFHLFEHTNTYTGVTTIQAGVLSLNWSGSLGAVGNNSGTYVAPGATLQFGSNEDPLSVSETVTLAGTITDTNTQPVQFNGSLIVEGADATINTNQVTINGAITGTGTLHKKGTGQLSISGGAANTFSGGFMADGGDTRLQKIGNLALPGPVTIGSSGVAAKITLLAGNQIADATHVQIVHEAGVLDTGAFSETIARLTMKGGQVLGTAAGQLRLNDAFLTTEASAATAAITAKLDLPPNAIGAFTIADGTASPDLRFDGVIAGNSVQKYGTGRMDVTPSMNGNGTLSYLLVAAGSALVNGQCPQLAIALGGGLIGGTGRVASINTLSSGTVAPGIDVGAFGTGAFTWNAATTFRVELNGTDPGSGYDQLLGYGAPNLGSAKLALTCGFDPAPGTSFMIVRNISGSAVNGTFTNAPQGGYVSAPGAKVFQISYTGGDGDDVVLTRVDMVSPTVVSFQITPNQGEGGDQNGIDMTIKGMPGLTYQLESSTDLVQWSPVKSDIASLQDGLIHFNILQPENITRLFFRARLP